MESSAEIKLKGHLEGADQALRLKTDLDERCRSVSETLVVDMSEVISIDYDGIVSLLVARNRKSPPAIELKNIPDGVKRIIETFHIPV